MSYTIIDVAKKAGVSKSTVSRVISGKGYTSEASRKKVLKAIKELQYKPNRVAQAMVSQQTNTIGVIIYRHHYPIASHPFYGKILDAILTKAEELNYSVFVTTDMDMSLKSADFMLERRVDGLILISRLSYEVIGHIEKFRVPYLIVNGTAEKDGVIQLFNKDQIGAKRVANYLNELGHQQVIVIAGPQNHRSHYLRVQGFCEQMKKVGHEVKKDDICLTSTSTFNAGYDALKKYWNHKTIENKPSAIFATNDMLALGAMKYLLEKNIQIPQDVSVIGFDNIDYAHMCHPTLTTVDVNKMKMGTDAVTLLHRLIKGESIEKDLLKIEYEPELIIRASTSYCSKERP